jgi:toxin-antitoxin system PIN domain toxin
MIVLDVNILVYAYNQNAPQQAAAAAWLNDLLKSPEKIGLPWLTVWAFVRISTNPRIWTNPLAGRDALAIVREWLSSPGVELLEPGPRHAELLEKLVSEYGATGTLVTDAALAALALENGATLASTDQNFRRFPAVKWLNPLAP